MRKVLAGAVAAAFVMASGIGLSARETVKGQLIDFKCFSESSMNTDADHGDMKDCAKTCALKGEPLALLTDGGDVYEVTGAMTANKNEKLAPHILHVVELTGKVTEKDGKKQIEAESLKMIRR